MAEQNYDNHTQKTYGFLAVCFVFLIYVGWAVYRLTQGVTDERLMSLVLGVTLIVLAFSLRGQVLTVQDRVIRLESRLRFHQLLPRELALRACELPVKQLVAIRFAGDDELPTLIQDVMDGKVSEPKAIKQAIKRWQADHLRA